MTKLPCITALIFLVVGCQATIGEPDDTVATFNVYTDQLEAMVIKECALVHGEKGCTPYPNEMECDTMSIEVKRDGRTTVRCVRAGQVVRQGYATVGDGVPFMCKSNPEMTCVTCLDIYGNTILDNCNRNAQLFRRAATGWGVLPDGTGQLLEEPTGGAEPPDTTGQPPDTTGQTPNPNPDDKCDAKNGFMLYAQELNKILAHEGLNFTWSPDLSKLGNPEQGFFKYKGNNSITCDAFAAGIKSKLHKCAVKKNGECYYCWQGGGLFGLGGNQMTCRCYRINVAAIKNACTQIPAGCDKLAWSGALIMAYGVANKWLFSPSYQNFYGQVDVPQNQQVQFPKCKGSPLVLDLMGDGVQPTSPAEGVRFDLLGFGALRTAWVKGDDALLALDRNDNGRIDDGTELFGEATGGRPHEDGFDALATLDTNHDGKVDSRDAQFENLVLWRDGNSDGVSQRSEVTPLGSAGISSLGVGGVHTPTVDSHGNDLSLRGAFTRADGSSGLMVDVFFVAR
jgi:hypothetical protein